MKKNNTLSFLFVLVQFVCIFLIIWGNDLSGLIPILISVVGLIVGFWAIYVMKFRVNIFPNVLKNQMLFIIGPYKYIRHPMYLSVLMVTGGFVISNFYQYEIIVWLILLVNMICKLYYEEGLLVVRFNEYKTYTKKSKRLIPFVW